jgi:hypothetical protein
MTLPSKFKSFKGTSANWKYSHPRVKSIYAWIVNGKRHFVSRWLIFIATNRTMITFGIAIDSNGLATTEKKIRKWQSKQTCLGAMWQSQLSENQARVLNPTLFWATCMSPCLLVMMMHLSSNVVKIITISWTALQMGTMETLTMTRTPSTNLDVAHHHQATFLSLLLLSCILERSTLSPTRRSCA